MAEGIFHFCAYDMAEGKGTEHGINLRESGWECDSSDCPDGICDGDEHCTYCHNPMDERK